MTITMSQHQRSRWNSSANAVSARLLVVVIAALSLVVALTFVSFASFSNSSQTTAATQTPSLGINPEQIYSNVNESVVTIQGVELQSAEFGSTPVGVLGTGFVIDYSNSFYEVTNFHVAGTAATTVNLTVTFADGNSYAAKVIGSDPYSDLAVVSALGVPQSEYHPINIESSSTLQIGQYVVAVGNPFGLARSMTFGIISQLGRTIQDPVAGNFSIAGAIQFSASINPGNSGGVLVNSNSSVVGITTAVVSGSQGVGFAIPSSTITQELPSLIENGSYNLHSYLGVSGANMNYQLARAAGTNVTYGVLIQSVAPASPASISGLKVGNKTVTVNGMQFLVGGDIIVSINGTRIVDTDSLATYLAQNTISGNSVVFGIIRNGSPLSVRVTLGTRPPPSG